jgi:oligosaccharide repeat unit polymerase
MVFLALIAILPFVENLVHVANSYFYPSNDGLIDIYENKMDTNFNFDEQIYWLDPVAKFCNSIILKFEYFNILLFFYYFTRPNRNNLLLFGLLVVVLNSVIFGLAMSGRSSSAFFILFSSFYLILFRKQISRKLFVKIVFFGGGTASFLILLLIILTTIRFEGLDFSPFSMLNHYIGEGVVLFNDMMWDIKRNTQGDNSFAFFKDLLGFDTFSNYLDRREYWNKSKTGIDPIRFYTYIGDWYSDFGPFFTLFFVILVSSFVRKLTYRKRQISFVGLYIFVSFGYILLCGFTIYAFSIYATTLNFIIGLLVSSLITFKYKKL